jgi:prepilin-type N-terminal cleavage/methylation domain-containing protein
MKTSTPKVLTGFTLIELLVVIAIIAILSAMMLPSLNRAKWRGQTAVCLGNQRTLAMAWQMYSEDFSDNIWPTPSIIGASRDACSSTNGWVNDNPYVNADPNAVRGGLAWPYISALGSYSCPADHSFVRDMGQSRRLRSYSMNAYMNCYPVTDGSVPYDGYYQMCYHKRSQIHNPAPSQALVLIEEHENSICCSSFGMNTTWLQMFGSDPTDWVSFPASRHGQSASISCADGHAEIWAWKEARTLALAQTYAWGYPQPSLGFGDRDWGRFARGVPMNNPPD